MAPNSVRAVLGGLVGNEVFHALDGSGYRFMAEQIIAVDQPPHHGLSPGQGVQPLAHYGIERQAAVKQALSVLTHTCPRTRAKWSV